MVITNYKDIIVVDNFITSEENDIFVSLIEKPKCYENNSYWRFLSSDNTVTPLTLNYYGNEIYSSVLEQVNDVAANNAYIDVKKRILRLLENKYKVEHSGLEKFSDYVPYICDKEMPVDGSSLGIPAPEADDHSRFLESQVEWGLTGGGNRNYVARIFINHDFKGGNLTFPQHNLDIKPVKDRLVLYPCSKEYIYGVRNIDGGSFYLTFWFTKA
jgi:hypothetical protein